MNIETLKVWLTSRHRVRPATTIVLHATDGASARSSINWLRQIGLSYHYVIERDGKVTKCVPLSRVAFHAGRSVGPQGPNVNNYSIGISFANFESRGEHITEAQIEACRALVAELAGSIGNLRWITRHRDVSPGRKTDPAMLPLPAMAKIAAAGGLQIWKPPK